MKSIEDIQQITSKSFNSMSEVDRYATRYCLIVLAEALASLVIHIARSYTARNLKPLPTLFSFLEIKG